MQTLSRQKEEQSAATTGQMSVFGPMQAVISAASKSIIGPSLSVVHTPASWRRKLHRDVVSPSPGDRSVDPVALGLLIRQQRSSRISASASTSYLCYVRDFTGAAHHQRPRLRVEMEDGAITVGASTNEESAARPESPNLAAVKLFAVLPHQPADLDDCRTISSDSRVPLLRAWACRCVTTTSH